MNLVKTSYRDSDVTILLKDLTGLLNPTPIKEREKLTQLGVHYSEMLPLEYKPTDQYMQIYEDALDTLSQKTATATALLARELINLHGSKLVLVSLARAGTPIGILLKRFIKFRYNLSVPHYSISIIRDKGIDYNAISYIVDKHGACNIQFVDGWIGKGAINEILQDACNILKNKNPKYASMNSTLAVLSDPAKITPLCGTHQDFLIPSACLNATVSGLISRTVLRNDLIGPNDFHGAIYYENLKSEDRSNKFLDKVCSYFNSINWLEFNKDYTDKIPNSNEGLLEVQSIGKYFEIPDITKIKPGVGETTRVLLRRVPYCVLIKDKKELSNFPHIKRLCEEKNVPILEYPLKLYDVCGIIKTMNSKRGKL